MKINKKNEKIVLPEFFGDDSLPSEEDYVSLRHICKVYDEKVLAVYDFNLNIKKKEFIVFVGPSGCGKSTTLRMIAGLEEITGGKLYIDGVLSNELTPKERDISMVFQSYALYPHMTVRENLGFGLKIRHFTKDEINKHVLEAAEILGLTEYLDRKPGQLSGGQRQRVALGRAIVRNAKLFLMDEPLSNLDAKLRVQMRSEIIKLHERLGTTTIYVTHDQTEAMTMATRIVVMKDGYIQQIGTPYQIYNEPSNLFVASFVGSPAMNLIDATYKDNNLFIGDINIALESDFKERHDAFYSERVNEYKKQLDLIEEKLADEKLQEKAKPLLIKNKEAIEIKLSNAEKALKGEHLVSFGVRPECLTVSEDGYDSEIVVPELLGDEYYLHCLLNGNEIVAKVSSKTFYEPHEIIKLKFDLERTHIFDKDSTLKI